MIPKNKTFDLGFALFSFLFFCLFLKTLTLWLRCDFNLVVFILSLALVQLYIWKFSATDKLQVSIYFYIALGLVFWISITQLDLSFDGNWYQKEGVLQIARGWNPFFDPPVTSLNATPSAAPWVNYYCKSAWLIGAVFYKTFGMIESAKSINLILIFSIYFLTFGAVKSLWNLPKIWLYFLATIVALNPVSLYQAFTLYVDGAMASSFCLCALFSAFVFFSGSSSAFCGLVMATVFMATLKSTGLVYALMILSCLFLFVLVYKRESIKKTILALLAFGILTLAIGFNPYVTSFKRYGSPFYPFSDAYSVSGITPPSALIYSHLLPEYRSLNRFEKLSNSLFSESSNTEGRLKFPLVVKRGEAGVFWNNDIKIGGFGPIFSGALLLALGILIGYRRWVVLIVPGFLLLTVLINPETSWARYIPQLYLIASYALFASLVFIKRGAAFNVPAMLLATLLIINLGIIGDNSLRRQLGLSHDIKNTLLTMENKNVLADFGIFQPLSTRLDEFKIKYSPISHEDALKLKNPIPLGAEMTLFEME